jgi:CheY-like chemotaxis protein
MPDMDGYETTSRLRTSARQRLPIVALTAAVTDRDRQHALDAGMDDFLCKPLDREILAQVLGKWLSKEAEPAQQVRK